LALLSPLQIQRVAPPFPRSRLFFSSHSKKLPRLPYSSTTPLATDPPYTPRPTPEAPEQYRNFSRPLFAVCNLFSPAALKVSSFENDSISFVSRLAPFDFLRLRAGNLFSSSFLPQNFSPPRTDFISTACRLSPPPYLRTAFMSIAPLPPTIFPKAQIPFFLREPCRCEFHRQPLSLFFPLDCLR